MPVGAAPNSYKNIAIDAELDGYLKRLLCEEILSVQ